MNLQSSSNLLGIGLASKIYLLCYAGNNAALIQSSSYYAQTPTNSLTSRRHCEIQNHHVTNFPQNFYLNNVISSENLPIVLALCSMFLHTIINAGIICTFSLKSTK